MFIMGKEREYIIHNDDVIKGFFGEYRWLSNFHIVDIYYDGVIYPSTEHAYQAAKSSNINTRKEFLKLSCKEAQLKGQTIKIVDNWIDIKYSVMFNVILYKFKHNDDLKKMLVDTGDKYLEETNHWGDTYYGVCNGEGQNKLGKILMEVREMFK